MLSRWQRHIVTESGDVIPGAEVEVTIAGEATLADLYSNAGGTTGQSNPFNADGGGYAYFYASGGTYDIYVNSVKIWEYVQIGTSQRRDIDADIKSVESSISIHTPDPLRASVEGATGGMCTVLYDDYDLPSIMRIIPAMNAGDLLTGKTGLHPAFLVGGVQIPEFFVGVYQASEVSGRAYSLPGKTPWRSINFDNARSACTSKGAGWHLMTNWEWAAIALWCAKNDFQPRGNTDYGRAHDAVYETGTFIGSGTLIPGDSGSPEYTLTGTGPYTWRHDGTVAGLADLVGNAWEWQDGCKLIDGRVYMSDDNDIGQMTQASDESAWPDTGHDITASNPWSSYDPAHTSDLLELGLIVPVTGESDALQGRLYVTTDGERMPFRGGARTDAGIAGLAALALINTRTDGNARIGFRCAYITP